MKNIWQQINEVVLPQALVMGVDIDRFWTMNPESLQPFVRAFELRREYDDELLWRQGIYNRLAIGSCLDKKCKYPEQPILVEKRLNSDPDYVNKKNVEKFKQLADMINIQLANKKLVAEGKKPNEIKGDKLNGY